MKYLKVIKKTAHIPFHKIDFKTPTKGAKKIQRQILAFFEKNPDGKVIFHFHGYPRLSQPFADTLFEGGLLNEHRDNIRGCEMETIDYLILMKALRKSTKAS
jgi:hypothetical protein